MKLKRRIDEQIANWLMANLLISPLLPIRIICFVGLLLSLQTSQAQTFQTEKMGLRFGASFSFGSHLRQLSLLVDAYFLPTERLQLNCNLRSGYAWRGYGPKIPRSETRLSVGALLGYGGRDHTPDGQFSPVGNQTVFRHAFAYAYNFYLDDIQASQRTGIIAVQLGQFFFVTENDAFADLIFDRFRTGTTQFGLEVGEWQIALNSLLWTGDPASRGRRDLYIKDYPARYGIVDLSDAAYGRFSHGILSLQLTRLVTPNGQQQLGQVIRTEVGIDAEQVRHFLQNRLIHDAFLLPKKWIKIQNRHVPMLDNNGFPYVFREDQMIRKPRFYGQFHLNPAIFW